MSSATSNYGLYLEDDSGAYFKTWREKLNSANNSNMVTIDTVLGEKADHSAGYTLTLAEDAWEGDGTPYSQTLAVAGMTAEVNGVCGIAMGLSEEQLEVVYESGLSVMEQGEGVLTVQATGGRPTCDIPIVLILFD